MQDELFDSQPANALRDWPPQPLPDAADQALWSDFLASATGRRLDAFVRARLEAGPVFPADPLRALRLTPLAQARVLILGQDPYHGPGQAQGLAFSVSPGTPVPPSLRNILKERARDLGPVAGPGPRDSLESWAAQGVLLLNSVLTVDQGRAASHARQGWEVFTAQVVQALKSRSRPMVFMAWGAHAQALCQDVPARHLLLAANHPSPLSATQPPRPFIGCGHFGAANRWLREQGEQAIVW